LAEREIIASAIYQSGFLPEPVAKIQRKYISSKRKGQKSLERGILHSKSLGMLEKKRIYVGRLQKNCGMKEKAPLAGSFPQTLTSLSSLTLREKSWST